MRFIALLRAINVGGRTVRMEELRASFEAMGFANVSTFIASGNVIFECRRAAEAALTARIERQLQKSLGHDVAVFLRSPAELDAIARHDPFPTAVEAGDARRYVVFLREPPAASVVKTIGAARWQPDELRFDAREIHWLSRVTMRESPVSGARLEKLLCAPVTVRNITTVRRLAERCGTHG